MTVIPCCAQDVKEAAKVLAQAFNSKFSYLNLREDMAAGLLKDTWENGDNHKYFVNKVDEAITGTAHIKWNGPDNGKKASNFELARRYGYLNAHRFAIGMNALYEDVDDGDCYIAALAVSKDHRGKGIATSMIDSMIGFAEKEEFDRVTLFVSDKNKNAIRLYERSGFKTEHTKNSFFENVYFREPYWRFMILEL